MQKELSYRDKRNNLSGRYNQPKFAFIYSFIRYVRVVPEAKPEDSQLFRKFGREKKEEK